MIDSAFTIKLTDAETQQQSPTVFRKQVIYVGAFSKGQQDFTVDDKMIDHWVLTQDAFNELGITVPVPEEHSEAPSAKRGEVVRLEKGPDSKGRTSLWSVIKFNDEKTANQYKHNDVSLYAPPKWEDSQKRTFYRPIKHIALTDYPVIPDLDGFQVLSLSLKEENSMTLMRALAEALGIAVGDDSSDESISDQVKAGWTGMAEKLAKMPAPKPDEEDDEEEDEETPKPPVAASETPAPHVPATVLSMVTNARTSQIDGLVSDGKITPAVAKDLKEQYTDGKALKLSMQTDTDDGFDRMIGILNKNEPVLNYDEQSGGQGLKLSAKDNPLIRNAEQRAEAAKR